MKSKAIIFLLVLSLLIPLTSINAATATNFKGKILIQTESKEALWYVNPKDGKRYALTDGTSALKTLKSLGVSMSEKDIKTMKTNTAFRKKYIGQVLYQTGSKGDVYYISSDGRYNYLTDGASTLAAMKRLGLGITNTNLNKIIEYKIVSKTVPNLGNKINCNKDLNCFLKAVKTCAPAVVESTGSVNVTTLAEDITQTISLAGLNSKGKCEHSSYISNVTNIRYAPGMLAYMKASAAESGLSDLQIAEALKVKEEDITTAKISIGMTTKCYFDTSYLIGIYENRVKGVYKMPDVTAGNCAVLNKKGEVVWGGN